MKDQIKKLDNQFLPPNPGSQPRHHEHHTVVETEVSQDVEKKYKSRCVALIDDGLWINGHNLGMEGPYLPPDVVEFVKNANDQLLRERVARKKKGQPL